MFEYNYKLVKVVDGDTIDVDIDLGFGVWLQKQRIRMMGIDTPESRTSDKEEKVYGLLAKEKLQTLLATGKVLKTYKEKGYTKEDAITQARMAYILQKDQYNGLDEYPSMWQPPSEKLIHEPKLWRGNE